MSKKDGMSVSMIFEASSANYGEGIGNISQLKKITKGNGEVYTYISRQAIRYNIIQQLSWDNTPVADMGVVQFAPDATIKDYAEIDLFGYMKTSKKGDEKGGQKIRSAVVRLSNAISLEPYNSDLDFLTNMGMAKRQDDLQNAIAQSEIHKSLYAYTVTIDLDKVGIDENDNIQLSKEEKSERVVKLIESLQFLWRDIKGRRENLNPIFAVGGLYERKNPYFEGRIELYKNNLNIDLIKDVIDSCEDTKNNTYVASLKGKFTNSKEVNEFAKLSINDLFSKLKEEVKSYYA
jgi:CRISPR-associated protein Cst2